MTSREIVLRALSHKTPERVPRDFCLIITEDRQKEIKEKIGNNDLNEYFKNDLRYYLGGVLLSDESQERLRSRFARYGHDYYPQNAKLNYLGAATVPGSFYHFYREIPAPCSRFTSLSEFKNYPFPSLKPDPEKYQHITERVKEIKEKGVVSLYGAWHILSFLRQLRGFEGFLTDFHLHPDIAEFLLEWCTEGAIKHAEIFAKNGVDIFRLEDDLGAQHSLLMSPNVFRKFIKPCFAKIISTAKRINPDVIIAMHSDGDIESIIPDLIEIGVEVLNPIQPECMDPAKLKKEYGKSLAFWGSIGTQYTLPFGSEKDVKEEVKLRMDTVGKGGGFIIGPSHVIEPEVPWRNIIALIDAIDEFGKY